MSRFGRLWLTVLVVIAAVAMASQHVLAGPQAPGGGELRRLPPPTPPPLPFNVAPTPLPTAAAGAAGALRGPRLTFSPDPAARKPASLSVTRAMALINPAARRIASASGSTIVLTGDGSIGNNWPVYDETLAYNSFQLIQCAGMRPGDQYRYTIFPPDGTSYTSNYFNTDGNGNCWGWFYMYFGTPFNPAPNPGTAAPYSGVWAIAMQNRATGQYETVTYFVVIASQHFETYADGALLHPSNDFTPGSTIYVNATGLNTSHQYAIGWVYTGGANLPCVYSVPTSAATRPGTCFVAGSTAGTAVPTGQLTIGWPTGASPATGTYSVELYDATANSLVGTQQISIEPSTLAWTLTPYNTAVGTGVNLNDTFATDGFIDASVTGLSYNITGLPASSNGHQIALTVSDPNGVVLNNGLSDNVPSGNLPAATQAGGTVTINQNPFPANQSLLTALGPTMTYFAPNVLTAQLYDQTLGTVLGSKSFTLLGYQGGFAWTNPSTNILATLVSGTNAQVTVSNTAGTAFGSWNADGISGVELSNDGKGELLALPGGNTTATDTAGNIWDVAYVGGASTQIKVTPDPANPTATLNGTTTLSFNVTVSLQSGSVCKSSPCNVQTSILPQHGIAYSALDVVSNSLLVLQQGAAYSGNATEAFTVTGGPAPVGAPRYDQAMYISGTSGATGNYPLTFTVSNSGPNEKIYDILLTFPNSYDANTQVPTLQSVTVGGIGQARWRLLTQGQNAALGTNQLELYCNGCTPIAFNKTVVYNMLFPMFPVPFGYQTIAGTADFNTPSGQAPYSLSSTGTVTSAIVGATNIDSTELAVYSLDPTTMSATFTPGAIPLGPLSAATATTLDFTNTSTASSSFPDYVDQLNLTVPQQIIPSSITVPANWYVQQTSAGPPATYVIQVCPIGSAKPCSSAYEQYSLSPGQTLPITFNYAAGANPGPAGTYNVQWTAVGANGGATTSPSENAPLQVTATSAQVIFTNVGGYVGALPPATNPTPVPAGSQPQVGTDASYTGGSSFLYQITNNGQKTISSVTLTVPGQTRAFTNGTDTAGVNWTFTTAPYVTGNGAASSGTCSGALNGANYSNPTTGGVNGTITLTGCNLVTGDVLDIYFNAHAPYDVGSYFDWPAQVTSTGAGGATITAQPPYPAADSLQIALDAQMNIITPPSGTNTVLTNPGPGGSTPVTSCLNCVVDTTQSPPLITLGNFVGTFTATDLVNASVTSDAASPDGWTLYASTNNNPLNGGGTQQLQTEGDAGHSTVVGGFTVGQTAFATLPVIASPTAGNPGLQISSFNGAAHRQPIDTIMSYYVNSTGSSSPQSAVITYTLVLN